MVAGAEPFTRWGAKETTTPIGGSRKETPPKPLAAYDDAPGLPYGQGPGPELAGQVGRGVRLRLAGVRRRRGILAKAPRCGARNLRARKGPTGRAKPRPSGLLLREGGRRQSGSRGGGARSTDRRAELLVRRLHVRHAAHPDAGHDRRLGLGRRARAARGGARVPRGVARAIGTSPASSPRSPHRSRRQPRTPSVRAGRSATRSRRSETDTIAESLGRRRDLPRVAPG